VRLSPTDRSIGDRKRGSGFAEWGLEKRCNDDTAIAGDNLGSGKRRAGSFKKFLTSIREIASPETRRKAGGRL